MADSGKPAAPLRVALCITDLDPGGAERALVELATRLDRKRFETAVFCLGPRGALAARLEAARIPVTCLDARRRSDLGVFVRLWKGLRTFRPQIVQTYLFHANIAGRIAGRLAGAKCVVSGIRVAERRARWPLWLDRVTNRLVAANVCVSRGVAEFSIREGALPAGKIVVIPNGVDVERFAKAAPAELTEFGIPRGARVVLTVGRLDPQKGLLTLLAAARRLLPEFRELHFLLVGEGPLRGEIERAIARDRWQERVHLAGWRENVPSLMQAAYCLALPSLWEGMPNVVLEAMAAGRPVVACRVEGCEELVVAGETGLLVPPGSVDDLTAAIRTLLQHPQRAEEMGRAARQRVQAEFSWDKSVAAYDALYQRLWHSAAE